MSRLAAIRRGRSVRAKISGGRDRPRRIFSGFYKTRHILLYDIANCTVLRAVVLTQYQLLTYRRTNRRNCVANTALAKRRAVKKQECRTPFTANIGLLACCQWAKPHMSGMVSLQSSVQNLTKLQLKLNQTIVIICCSKRRETGT